MRTLTAHQKIYRFPDRITPRTIRECYRRQRGNKFGSIIEAVNYAVDFRHASYWVLLGGLLGSSAGLT